VWEASVWEVRLRVDIHLLGGFSVVVDGERIPDPSWSRRQAGWLVKLLALHPGHRMPREQVIDALWPDLLLDEAAPRLHKAAHYARAALGPPNSLVLTGDVVALFPEAELHVDVERFDDAAEAFRSGDGTSRADEALKEYEGDLLPDDLYEPWTEPGRELRRTWYRDLLRATGRWDRLVATDPLDEEAHLRLVSEHVKRGDRAAALHQLDLMQEVWRRELDDEPGDAAQRLRDDAMALPAYDADRPVARARRATPIPHPATPTIGRDREIEAVLELLEQSRIVTLMGIGGVGKTRLSAEVAHAFVELTLQHSCFVDLTMVREADLVTGLIARELGIHVGSSTNAEQMLAEALRGRSMLLVLDNFEHVIDAADVVAEIVTWSPDVRVLVTSRARLNVTGERVFEVNPLSFEGTPITIRSADAVAFFAQAARAVDPAFDLDANLDDVVAICRAVDGLPLAIELAAGHLRTLPPSLLRSRLGARLGSAEGAARDIPARQRTIPNTIDWSLQLLGSAEQQLFARMGVFTGAVELDAVERVCGEPGQDVVAVLGRLIDQSLVRRVADDRDEVRFVLLELVRERARDLLEPTRETIADRHAGYVVERLDDIAERRWTDAADCWIDLVSDVLGEIRAANTWAQQRGNLEWSARIAAALATFWHIEGHHVEGRRWVREVLIREDELDNRLRARIRLAAGFLEWPKGRFGARRHWEAAIDLLRNADDDRYLAYSLALTSVSYLGEDAHYASAMRLNNEGLALARQVGEAPLITQVLNVRGELTRVAGDDELARSAYEEGLGLARAVGDQAYAAVFLANLSYLADHRGDYEEARRLTTEALRMSRSMGRRLMTAWSVSELSGPELGLGRPERAAVLIGAADEALRVLGSGRHPGDKSEYDRVLSGLRDALGEARLEQLLAEGARLSLDEAVELGLSDAAVTGPSPSAQSVPT
jgi:predicted ATPase